MLFYWKTNTDSDILTAKGESAMDVVPKPQSSVDAAQWEEKVKTYHLPRAEINKVRSVLNVVAREEGMRNVFLVLVWQVVMEYLVKEGFKDAVAAFQEESGIDPGVNMSILDDQIRIRDAVEAGTLYMYKLERF